MSKISDKYRDCARKGCVALTTRTVTRGKTTAHVCAKCQRDYQITEENGYLKFTPKECKATRRYGDFREAYSACI